MRILLTLLKWGGYIWTAATGLFLLFGLSDIGLRKGWPALLDFLAPAHAIHWLVMILTVAPGPLAVSWARTLNEEESALREQEALWDTLSHPRAPSEKA